MAIRDEIRQTLSEMRLDNTPTSDHRKKVDFIQKGGVWRKRSIAERLYSQEKINQETFDACERWLTMYILSYDGAGAIQNGTSTAIIRHDAISWRLHMAKEIESIPKIKEIIGAQSHNMLILSLYYGYCTTELCRMLLPKRTPDSARSSINQCCINSFEKLLSAYKELQKK